MTSIGLPEIVAGAMLIALMAYALTGGADFGGGVWDLLASGPRREAQRDHIATSLAPIWEANHVWLIIVVVVLFTGFPAAFSEIAIVLHIPLTIMLVGIVMRGSAFVFRSYGARTEVQRHRWGAIFAIASVITPVFLGVIVGSLASGRVGAAAGMIGKAPFGDVFVAPWLAVFPMIIGLLALSLFAFLAAVYLARNAPDDLLQEDFRRRALAGAAAVFILAFAALLAGHRVVPLMEGVLTAPVQLFTGVAAVTAIVALLRRHYGLARAAAAAQVLGILGGWALAQFPYLVPGSLTIQAAAAPRETLVLLLVGLAVGTAVLVPALRYLFRIFATAPDSAT